MKGDEHVYLQISTDRYVRSPIMRTYRYNSSISQKTINTPPNQEMIEGIDGIWMPHRSPRRTKSIQTIYPKIKREQCMGYVTMRDMPGNERVYPGTRSIQLYNTI